MYDNVNTVQRSSSLHQDCITRSWSFATPPVKCSGHLQLIKVSFCDNQKTYRCNLVEMLYDIFVLGQNYFLLLTCQTKCCLYCIEMTTIKSSQIHQPNNTSCTFVTGTITAVQQCFSWNDNCLCLAFVSMENNLFQV